MNDHHTYIDEIDQFLFDFVGVQPGCCSSIDSVKYTIARRVAEALWPKKDLALSCEDVKQIVTIAESMLTHTAWDAIEYPDEQKFYEEVLKRFNESKQK